MVSSLVVIIYVYYFAHQREPTLIVVVKTKVYTNFHLNIVNIIDSLSKRKKYSLDEIK